MNTLTPEDRLKLLIGDLHFQIAVLTSRLDEMAAKQPIANEFAGPEKAKSNGAASQMKNAPTA